MRIEDFYELAIIQMERQSKTWTYLGSVIGTSATYAKQVVQGVQKGPAAKKHKRKIAENLDIILAKEDD